MLTSPSQPSSLALDAGDFKIQKVAPGACAFFFYGANHRTSMLLPSPLLKHVNDGDVRSLVEARWAEHWMEDRMLGAGRDKDHSDGLGLLQQQLHRAQLEARLLEMALNRSKSVEARASNNSGCTTSVSPSDDLSQPMESLDINAGRAA